MSYPKSGNTWVRILLANYLSTSNQPVSLHELPVVHASSRTLWENCLGVSTFDLALDELAAARSTFFATLEKSCPAPQFVKTHDAYHEGFLPESNQFRILYIVRHPFDVAVSFARHLKLDIKQVLDNMSNPRFTLVSDQTSPQGCLQLPQRLSTWSGHVSGWLSQTVLSKMLLRYEDLALRPEEKLFEIVNFFRLPLDSDRIRNAVRQSSFSNLQKQEQQIGFPEKPAHMETFFWKGVCGSGMKLIPSEFRERFIASHETIMKEFDYL